MFQPDRLDIVFELPQQPGVCGRRKGRSLEIGGQRDMQQVRRSIVRTIGLRVRAACAHQFRREAVPERGGAVAGGEFRRDTAQHARQIGRQRHVHDRETGQSSARYGAHQPADIGRGKGRLLHREDHEVETVEIDIGGPDRAQRAAGRPGRDIDQACATLAPQPDTGPVRVQPRHLGRMPDQYDRMTGKDQLYRQKQAVSAPQDQYTSLDYHPNSI